MDDAAGGDVPHVALVVQRRREEMGALEVEVKGGNLCAVADKVAQSPAGAGVPHGQRVIEGRCEELGASLIEL